jgi:beta-glucosidase-like glycosyl hydrolase
MRPWTDTSLSIAERVESLLGEMTLDEKLAQLGSAWVGAQLGSGNVAPLQEAFGDPLTFEQASADGLGHLTRPLGTQPIDPVEGARRLAALQQDLVERTRLGVPAIAHDECLTGFTTFRATVFPTALAWAATFDPALVERMTRAIGESMHAVGVHQGLSPVLDVVRDYRWGRVEETLGEDPYLVGVIGTAYVRGLESAGVVATLKHFAGYSASQAARNHAPVAVGPRTLRDVLLLPFEMALREGGARSVMNSYSEIDGLPVGADAGLLTGVLRDEWGFEGVVVSDYWAIAFLQLMHRVAGSPAEAGALALEAGIDVELPHVSCYHTLAGAVPEELVARAARRVLRQKAELGLLDADWSPESPAMAEDTLDIDPPEHRAIARELAEASAVLLSNDGTLPLNEHARTVALVGPCADDPLRLPRLLLVPEPRRHARPRGARARRRGPDAPRRAASRAARGDRRPRGRLPGPGARPVGAPGGGGGGPLSRRLHRRGRRSPRSVRARHLRRGLRRRGSLAARDPGRTARRAARDGHAARPRGGVGASVRARALRRPAGGRRAGVHPRGGGRPRARRHPQRARRAVGQAARADPAQRGRAAEHLPASRPAGATARA